MSDHHVRLPSIAELVSSTSSADAPLPQHLSSDRWPSSSQRAPPPPDSSVARCTPLAAPPLRPHDGSAGATRPSPWRAINPPPPPPPSHHPSDPATALGFERPSPVSPTNHHAPPRKALSHPEAATMDDPPTTARQDSAVSETRARASPASTILPELKPDPPAAAAAMRSPRPESKEDWSRYPNARDTASYPTTPPSSAPSPESHPPSTIESGRSTAHDRQRPSPPAVSRYAVDNRSRALSDPQTDVPTPSKTAPKPRRTKSSRVPTQSNMPPPPSPVSTVSGPVSSVLSQTHGPASKHPAKPTQQQAAAEHSLSGLKNPSTSSYRRHEPALVGDSQPRCHYCKEVWDYTPPDENTFRADPSTNVHELANTSALLLHSYFEQGRMEAESYHDWARQHLVEPTDENTTVPCPARERVLRPSPKSNKRKADAFEDRPAPIKHFREHFQELSCDPPPLEQLTPPPDPPSAATPKQKPLYSFKTESGEIKLNGQLAAVLGMPEVPRYPDQPLNDTDRMFGHPKSRSSNREQDGDKLSPQAEQPHVNHAEQPVSAEA